MITSKKMSMKNYIAITTLLLFSTACSNDIKSSLGLKKHAPDEFTVISNPSLSVPPDFSLTKPGIENKTTLVPSPINSNQNLNPLEQEFINKLGQQNSNSSISQNVDKEYHANKNEQKSKGVIRKAIDKLNAKSQPTIDPYSEKERIQNNIDNNLPINQGQTKNKSKSTLDRLLN